MADQLFNNPNGHRGSTLVQISFADLYVIVREKLNYFHPDRSDPDAFCQDLGCRIENGMGIFPNVPGLEPDSDDAPAAPPSPAPVSGEDWRNDPSADERWCAGLDYGQTQLCNVLGVDPATIDWDAATETLDGDVQSVIGKILTARFGDDCLTAAIGAQPQGWRAWHGGECPVPKGTAGEVKVDDGEIVASYDIAGFNWSHGPDSPASGRKIVGYRITAAPLPSTPEGGE